MKFSEEEHCPLHLSDSARKEATFLEYIFIRTIVFFEFLRFNRKGGKKKRGFPLIGFNFKTTLHPGLYRIPGPFSLQTVSSVDRRAGTIDCSTTRELPC